MSTDAERVPFYTTGPHALPFSVPTEPCTIKRGEEKKNIFKFFLAQAYGGEGRGLVQRWSEDGVGDPREPRVPPAAIFIHTR